MVHSSTKGATAICAHLLAARSTIDLDDRVADHWPEFAEAGKEAIPVRWLLDHQAGLPAIAEKLPSEAALDWDTMTRALAAQPPWWEPGTAHGYHAITFGWLVGEVVRRASGKSLGTYFRQELAEPLGLDFWIGLPESVEPRVARLIPPPLASPDDPFGRALLDRESLTRRAFLNPPTLFTTKGPEFARAIRAAEIPAANGMATARALAGLYAPLASPAPGGMFDRAAVTAMSTVESEGPDRILVYPTRFSSGFMKTIDNRPRDSAILGPNPEAFGHVGAGGSIGMADPAAGVAIGYVMNRMGPGILVNDRGQSLIDAVYDCF
jgi:CubicO group peptidase (beta-lactamase class C family)